MADEMLFLLLTFTLTLVRVIAQSEVIVVGGGLAGISAARDLVNSNYNVTVVEARSRPGGRIWSSDQVGSDIDLGASFIFPNETEILNKSIELKLSLNNVTVLNCMVRDHARGVTDTADFVQDVLLAMLNLQKVHQRYNSTLSITEALQTSGVDQKLDLTGGSAWTVGKHIMEMLMGGEFSQMSIGVRIPSAELQQVTHVVKDGMESLIESLIMGRPEEPEVNLVYNSEVTKIEKTEQGYKVFTNGNVMTAKHVVMAVPAAVLKTGRIQFVPELSEARRTALQHVGVGVVNKLVLEFDQVFWGTGSGTAHFMGYLPDKTEGITSLMYWLNYHHITKKPILVGFLTGQDSMDSERMRDDQVRDLGLAILRNMFGNTVVNERTLVTYYNTKWGTDRFSLGSHVFRSPEMKAGDFEELSKSDENLHFIGDYTGLAVKGLGTVTSAYFSGKRVQQNILYIDKFVTPSTKGPSTATTSATQFKSPTTTLSPLSTDRIDTKDGKSSAADVFNYSNKFLSLFFIFFSIFYSSVFS